MARKNAYAISASSDLTTYQFTSTSDGKVIDKRIEFENLDVHFEGRWLYNLAFGDIRTDGTIDDETESNNGDIIRIMATIFSIIYEFTAAYPERGIYFTGSSLQRTNFYQEILRRKYTELISEFQIFGEADVNEVESELEEFEVHKKYNGFVVIRKLNDD